MRLRVVVLFCLSLICLPQLALAKGLIVYEKGPRVFDSGPLPASLAQIKKLEGARAGYRCEVFGLFWAVLFSWDCEPVAYRGDTYFTAPALATAISAVYKAGDYNLGFWPKHGRWVMLGAVLMFVLALPMLGLIGGLVERLGGKRRDETLLYPREQAEAEALLLNAMYPELDELLAQIEGEVGQQGAQHPKYVELVTQHLLEIAYDGNTDDKTCRATLEEAWGIASADDVESCLARLLQESRSGATPAWDIARALHVIRLAAAGGLLERERAWQWAKSAREHVIGRFADWRDYANNYSQGRRAWGGDGGATMFDESIERLLRSPISPWRLYPFPR
ncbi:MAG: DUF1266 domain-containing protein [Deltaproteobacteria bacterium]|nr:DUF1266 domain-containing protein [Deltaproteobacteria bacterium]